MADDTTTDGTVLRREQYRGHTVEVVRGSSMAPFATIARLSLPDGRVMAAVLGEPVLMGNFDKAEAADALRGHDYWTQACTAVDNAIAHGTVLHAHDDTAHAAGPNAEG